MYSFNSSQQTAFPTQLSSRNCPCTSNALKLCSTSHVRSPTCTQQHQGFPWWHWDLLQNWGRIPACDRKCCILGFTINPIICEWVIQDTNWLGHWLTPTSLKPWKKHISAIHNKDLYYLSSMKCVLFGTVNTYWLVLPKWAHLVKPLSYKSGEKTFCWTPDMDNAFKIMKTILAANILMA